MAGKALKGLTIQIGAETTELNKALDKVEKQGKDLSSELGQINKLLKLDPKNTELLAQKQKVLADAIGSTEKKLDTLKEAEKQAQEQFKKGEISEQQYRALQREIIATEKKLDGYKRAAKETDDAVEALGKEAGQAADKIEEQGEETEKTDKATDDLDDSANSLALGGLAAVAAAATAAVTAIVALAEESREYRNEMAKLNTAFEDNGHSAEVATKTYEALQSVLGETDQAVEAANMLAGFCETEEELAEWTDILTGAYAKFGNSLPIEGLAEAVNETVRTGQVTGQLADALNWAGAEGEMFGLKLKTQINWTKKSNEEIKKMTQAEKDAYEAQERRYKNIEEWNKAIEEAAGAEDLFNIALEQCSDEQERQQLITKYLSKTYKSAAAQFKDTNKEVIRANQATEKWNKATAKIGKTVEPVVTDIKELGVTLLEDASEPLEDIADYIRKDVLPAIEKAGKWVKKNGPVIKGTLVGITAALVAYKVATVATTVAHKGLKGAILATAAAEKVLALAQAATPWGLVAVAVTGVYTALVAYGAAMDNARRNTTVLTTEEQELAKAADEAAQAFRDQQAATNDNLAGITAQMGYVSNLASELRGLASASGKVKEEDKKRAQFILNELNEALGTEYTMTGNVINQYKDLKKSIDEVIKSKLANSLIEAANADYVAAIQAEGTALENLHLKEKDLQAQREVTKEQEKNYTEALALYNEKLADARETGNYRGVASYEWMLSNAERLYNIEKENLDKKQTDYDQAAVEYGNYYNTIANYEEAQAAVLSGNYDTAVDLLSRKGGAYRTYSDTVDAETAKVLDTLYKEAVDAGLEAERTRKNFENGVDGYTEEMVKEAEKGYEDALDEFATAYADAEGVGEDLGDGLSGGMENKRGGLLAKARSLVSGIIAAMREEADSNSPAQKTIDFGEDVGAGAEIGIERKTKDVKRAATKQAAAVLGAYNEQEVNAQRALRDVADQQAARQTAGQQAAASANGPMLEKILAAVEAGQVLALDGDALVGGTADKMDRRLGQLRVLAARGAK